jgi:hypothetical protein
MVICVLPRCWVTPRPMALVLTYIAYTKRGGEGLNLGTELLFKPCIHTDYIAL